MIGVVAAIKTNEYRANVKAKEHGGGGSDLDKAAGDGGGGGSKTCEDVVSILLEMAYDEVGERLRIH